METRDAMRQAQDEDLDLIEIAPNAAPPVCRIMDFGKYKYQISKKAKEAKKKQHNVKLKEIKFRPKTDPHDYQYKMEHAKEFLQKGDRVKVTVVFRGREMAHLEFGRRLVDQLKADLEGIASAELEGRMEGKRMTSILVPVSSKTKPSKPKEKKPEANPEPATDSPAPAPAQPA